MNCPSEQWRASSWRFLVQVGSFLQDTIRVMKKINNEAALNAQGQFVYMMNAYNPMYVLDPSQFDMLYCDPL